MIENPDLSLKARRFERWLSVAILTVAALLILECMSVAGLFRESPPVGDSLVRFAIRIVYAIPALVYLAALWRIRSAFSSVANGMLFAPIVAKTLREVGWMVAGGAILALAFMPTVHRLFGDNYPRLIEFDISSIALGMLGIGIVFLAKLIDRADSIQSELEEIF